MAHTGHSQKGRAATPLLLIALSITLAYSVIEAVAGWYAGSLALLGDAGHMLSDSFALGLAGIGAWLAQRRPTRRHTYGLGRSELLAALFNSALMIAIVIAIVIGATHRLMEAAPVAGETVTLVATIGLLINGLVAWLLSRGQQNVNTQAALLHVLGDLLGSIAALTAGVVILWTGWTPIDPILSLFIAILILASSVKLLRDTLHLLLDGVPPNINLERIGQSLGALESVHAVHDLHVWHLSASRIALTAHLVIDSLEDWETVLEQANRVLSDGFGIDHITLQPELHPADRTLYRIAEPDY